MAFTVVYLLRMFSSEPIEAPNGDLAGEYMELLTLLYSEYQQFGVEVARRTWDDSQRGRYPAVAGAMAAYARNRKKLYSISDLRGLPPVGYLYQDMIVKGGYNVIYGAPNCGKTFWALAAAAEIAQTHRVIYIAGEGEAGFDGRISALTHYHEMDEGRLNINFGVSPLSLLDEYDTSLWIEELRSNPPTLIVIDTLARAMVGADENSAKDMGIVNCHVDRLRHELGSAVLLVHHTGHSEGHERGSSALRGAVDMMLELKDRGNSIELKCIKAKYGEQFEKRHYRLVPVVLDDGRSEAVLVPSEPPSGFSENELKILAYLATAYSGAPTAEILKALQLDDRTFQKARARLEQNDHVSHAGKGQPYYISPKGRVALKNAQGNDAAAA